MIATDICEVKDCEKEAIYGWKPENPRYIDYISPEDEKAACDKADIAYHFKSNATAHPLWGCTGKSYGN